MALGNQIVSVTFPKAKGNQFSSKNCKPCCCSQVTRLYNLIRVTRLFIIHLGIVAELVKTGKT